VLHKGTEHTTFSSRALIETQQQPHHLLHEGSRALIETQQKGKESTPTSPSGRNTHGRYQLLRPAHDHCATRRPRRRPSVAPRITPFAAYPGEGAFAAFPAAASKDAAAVVVAAFAAFPTRPSIGALAAPATLPSLTAGASPTPLAPFPASATGLLGAAVCPFPSFAA
jgi:hypothetical protein